MSNTKTTFREALENSDRLSITWELVPGRGAWEESQEHVLEMAKLAGQDDRINGITITDNPGGRPAILASTLAIEANKYDVEPIIHFTSKDKNRNDIESELYAMARSGVKNLLVMTGDYPSEGYTGQPKPVFDMDSVQTLRMIERMNSGQDIPAYKGRMTLKATNFFTGAVVSPFKQTEAELMTQYYKLEKKVNSGARFIISQLGYDVRKFDELQRYVRLNQLDVKLIGNIYVLSPGVARIMNKNRIPGCVVTDELVEVIEEEDEKYDNIKEQQLLRSAKLYAILTGLGYDGVNISGHGLEYEDIDYIINKGEELSPDWDNYIPEFDFPQENGYYYFKKDHNTGLNTDELVNRDKTGSKNFSLSYMFFNCIHQTFFDRNSFLYPLTEKIAGIIDNTFLKKTFTWFEYKMKSVTNNCQFCGDCALHEIAYQCPMSQCPKEQRNGPCGGTYNGWCEVYPGEQKCIYVTAYQRLKAFKQEDSLKDGYIPPCDWELYRTSSWLNYFNGRDYSSKNDENM